MDEPAPRRIRQLRQQLTDLRASLAQSDGETELAEEIIDLEEELAETIEEFQVLTCEGLLMATASCEPTPRKQVSALHFNWSTRREPCIVMVEEEIEKKGKQAKMRYEVWLQPLNNDGLHNVELRGLQFLQVEQQDATTPKMRERLATATVLAQSIPHIQVDRAGRFVGITGLDRLTSQLNRLGVPVNDQQIRAMASAAAKFWYAWVGSWVGLPVTAPDTEGTVPIQHMLPEGLAVPSQANWSSRSVPDHDGLWSLKIEGRVEDESARPLLEEALAFFFKSDQAAIDLLEAGFGTSLRLQALMDPQTMRPHHVVREIDAGVPKPGGGTFTQRERQTFTFTW